MTSIFYFEDYREAINALLADRAKFETEFTLRKLADQTRIEKSYLSKVLNGTRDLSQDQIYLVAQAFHLDYEEISYFSLLLEYARTAVSDRKLALKKQIRGRRTQKRKIQKNLSAKMEDEHTLPQVLPYYLEPLTIIIHHFLSLPEFSQAPLKIATALGVTSHVLNRALKTLLSLNLIAKKTTGSGYIVPPIKMHLPTETELHSPYHFMIRSLSSNRLMQIPTSERMTFSMSFTADEEAKIKIHENFLEFLKAAEKIIVAAETNGVYQMNFDLFPWVLTSDG